MFVSEVVFQHLSTDWRGAQGMTDDMSANLLETKISLLPTMTTIMIIHINYESVKSEVCRGDLSNLSRRGLTIHECPEQSCLDCQDGEKSHQKQREEILPQNLEIKAILMICEI